MRWLRIVLTGLEVPRILGIREVFEVEVPKVLTFLRLSDIIKV